MDPTHLVLLGMIFVAGGFSFFRVQRRVEKSQARDVVDEAGRELQHARESVLGQVRQLEVRLLEQSRELEAQLTTRIAILDQLVAEADRRIYVLKSDLAEAKAVDRGRSVADRRAA